MVLGLRRCWLRNGLCARMHAGRAMRGAAHTRCEGASACAAPSRSASMTTASWSPAYARYCESALTEDVFTSPSSCVHARAHASAPRSHTAAVASAPPETSHLRGPGAVSDDISNEILKSSHCVAGFLVVVPPVWQLCSDLKLTTTDTSPCLAAAPRKMCVETNLDPVRDAIMHAHRQQPAASVRQWCGCNTLFRMHAWSAGGGAACMRARLSVASSAMVLTVPMCPFSTVSFSMAGYVYTCQKRHAFIFC